MNVDLPDKFVQKMKLLLGDEINQFLESYNDTRYYGLRVNELKVNAEHWFEHSEMKVDLNKVPWCREAYYYHEAARPAKHPDYHAGLYYIQEPSAMVPVELLDVKPGCRVLDLCAAPGGKSTQIASKLNGQGVLVSNDLATERTKPLSKNIELAGVRNAIVLNEHPAKIAASFPEWFDRILVDAPCSGEGMFRKSPAMIDEWLDYSVDRCAKMQSDILQEVATMLAPGGRIVYSTCTFSPEENEDQIAAFLAEHDDFSIVQVNHQWGWSQGNPQWVSASIAERLTDEQLQSLRGTVRLWPHRTMGEGHFVAVLQRSGSRITERLSDIRHDAANDLEIDWGEVNKSSSSSFMHSTQNYKKNKKNKLELKERQHKGNAKSSKSESSSTDFDMESIYGQFYCENIKLSGAEQVRAMLYGSRLYFQPKELPSLEGLKVIRAGWPIGECKHNKFVPYHSLAMALKPDEAMRVVSFPHHDEQLIRYLKGETIFIDKSQLVINSNVKINGYVLICNDNFPVGFGKYVDGMIKNELPAGWRLI